MTIPIAANPIAERTTEAVTLLDMLLAGAPVGLALLLLDQDLRYVAVHER